MITTEAAASAVMCALTSVFSGQAALPPGVRSFFDRCPSHEPHAASPRPDRAELLRSVADHLGGDLELAERVARAVLSALRARLHAKEIAAVERELAPDVVDLFRRPLPLRAPAVAPGAEDVVAAIEDNTELPLGFDGATALAAVMCTLGQHLGRKEARHVIESLPGRVQQLLTQCMLHPGRAAGTFDRDEFLQSVAEHLDTTPWHAQDVARVVFGAIKGALSPEEARAIGAELPRGIESLWESG